MRVPTSSQPQRPGGVLVLVLDDDELSRELLTLLLESEGYATISFASGDAVLASLRSGACSHPRAIVADLQMPGITGNALAAELRALCGRQTRLLAVSATVPAPQAVAAFDGFLLKPFTGAQLTAALESSSPTAPQPTTQPEQAETRPILDETVYQTLAAAIQPAQLRQLYGLSLSDTTGRIGRMRAHATAGDESAYIREAHAIKGGCGLVGAAEMEALAAAMETGGLTTHALLDQISAAAGRLQRILESRSNT